MYFTVPPKPSEPDITEATPVIKEEVTVSKDVVPIASPKEPEEKPPSPKEIETLPSSPREDEAISSARNEAEAAVASIANIENLISPLSKEDEDSSSPPISEEAVISSHNVDIEKEIPVTNVQDIMDKLMQETMAKQELTDEKYADTSDEYVVLDSIELGRESNGMKEPVKKVNDEMECKQRDDKVEVKDKEAMDVDMKEEKSEEEKVTTEQEKKANEKTEAEKKDGGSEIRVNIFKHLMHL